MANRYINSLPHNQDSTHHGLDPVLYLALQSTAIINNALLTLFLLAAFSTIYDVFRFWLQRRPFSSPPVRESLRKLPPEPCKSFISLKPKSIFYTALFLALQSATSNLLTHLSWLLTNASLKNRNLRRRCSRLHARGLECSTTTHYHSALNTATALMLLVFIRAFELHVKQPHRQDLDDTHSPGFLRLKTNLRWLMQTLLAAPTAVVYVYTRAARQRLWSCLRPLLVQAAVSCAVFLLGNFVCLVAALPVSALVNCWIFRVKSNEKKDFQGTMDALQGLGIMGVRA